MNPIWQNKDPGNIIYPDLILRGAIMTENIISPEDKLIVFPISTPV